MECPYCAEEIKEDAVICRHCQRDVGPFRLVLRKVAGLEGKLGGGDENLAELAGRVAAIEQKFEELKLALLGLHGEARPLDVREAEAPQADSRRAPWWKVLLLAGVAPILALLAAYVLTVLMYDLDTRVLRVLSILLPLPFGFWFVRSARGGMGTGVLLALAVGGISVWGMSAILAWHDQISVMPQDAREWREVIEYMASIALSQVTGVLVARWLARRRHLAHAPGTLAKQLARALSDNAQEQGNLLARIQRTIDRAQELYRYAAIVGTAAMSAYTGLKPFIGD